MKRCLKIFGICLVALSASLYAQESEENFDDELLLEGEGLTIVRNAERQESKSGVSVVLSKEQMDTTARSGMVEDVMSSVSTLPGITFGGQWNKEPSVRGGYPREMTCVLDGNYLLFPWHWGGAYSIFSPDFVESTKLLNGVFSSRYGKATSGLLEIQSIVPDDQIHFSLDLNYISTSLFFSSPIGSKTGISLGAKATYLETLIGTFRALSSSDLTDSIKTAPYIRDFFAKGYYNPTDKISLSLIGFFGSDGIGYTSDGEEDEDSGLKSDAVFDYDYYQGLLGFDVKWNATDRIDFHSSLSYAFMIENLKMDDRQYGYVKYNQDFIDKWGSDPRFDLSSGGYNLDVDQHFKEKINSHIVQGRVESDVDLNESNKISFGIEEVVNFSSSEEFVDSWFERQYAGTNEYFYGPIVLSIDNDGNRIFNSSSYVSWVHGTDDDLISTELGVRLDHIYVDGDGINVNSLPDVNPRANVFYTPWRNTEKFEKVTFSAGAGFFSAVPILTNMLSKDVILDDDLIDQDRAVLGVIGTELVLKNDWKLSIEAYYKYYLNRLYIVEDDRNPMDNKIYGKTDGKGYVAGFDLMASKDFGKKWNGYASYSFIYSKYKNPFEPLYTNQRSMSDDPLNEWYFPSFHRFNTLNVVFNYKPVPTWTISLCGTFATGTPRTDGEKFSYPVKLPDGTVMQRYTRNSFYSDTLRTEFSCPIDVRVAHNGSFKKHPEWKWEWYVGAEDIFMNLYSPQGSKQFDQNTGKEKDSSDANFGIGIPMISLGLKISY